MVANLHKTNDEWMEQRTGDRESRWDSHGTFQFDSRDDAHDFADAIKHRHGHHGVDVTHTPAHTQSGLHAVHYGIGDREQQARDQYG
jgi:hypothetical protein